MEKFTFIVTLNILCNRLKTIAIRAFILVKVNCMTLREIIDEELDLKEFNKQFAQLMQNLNTFSDQAKSVYNDPNILKNFEMLKQSGMAATKALQMAQQQNKYQQQANMQQQQQQTTDQVAQMSNAQRQQNQQNKEQFQQIQKSIETLNKERKDDSTKQIASIVTKEIEKQLKNLGKKQKN